MLSDARITAIVPVSDIDAAVDFYEGRLGLRLERRREIPTLREAELGGGTGTLLLYESMGAGKSRHTVAAFRVDDIEDVVGSLREHGVVFDEYDLPEVKTKGGIALLGAARAAWCKDPDGNILAIESIA